MRKVSWTKRFAAEHRHFGGHLARISLGKATEPTEAALQAGYFSLSAQHEEGRVLVRSRTRPKRVLRSVVGHLTQVTLGTRKRGHAPRNFVWWLPQ